MHVVNRTNGRGFCRANVAITSEVQSYENESAALLEGLEHLEQIHLPTYDPATYREHQQYWMSPDLRQYQECQYPPTPSQQQYSQDARLQAAPSVTSTPSTSLSRVRKLFQAPGCLSPHPHCWTMYISCSTVTPGPSLDTLGPPHAPG